jgi:hypothetical protein
VPAVHATDGVRMHREGEILVHTASFHQAHGLAELVAHHP